ncbi:MAG TPA: peptidoglycan-binding domain-containing protein [Burkholderiales bacterium]|nr:peptidoglycan-binding domain-containing protein [Burkholderiales bacterium]
MSKGSDIVRIARKHIGERYILGASAPKNNAGWTGPWDCAEFASWCVYQAAGVLYGCLKNSGDPAIADAYTGYWQRDAEALGKKIPVAAATATPGAFLLRYPAAGLVGHIVISDGKGGTVEAHSSNDGVIASTIANRRWDTGILVPGIDYVAGPPAPAAVAAPALVLRLRKPPMTGAIVKQLQRALKARDCNPGKIDGSYGPQTAAAVHAFQLGAGLVADGEAGAQTLKALRVKLPRA